MEGGFIMPILAYSDIISRNEAKNYLRIDSSLTEDDFFIDALIAAAFQYIEKTTNQILVETDKKYYSGNPTDSTCRHTYTIYDFPIVEVLDPASTDDYKQIIFDTKNQFITRTSFIELKLGYDNVSDIPEPIRQAAFAIIQVWYYNSEKTIQSNLIPDSVKFAINPYRRFPIC